MSALTTAASMMSVLDLLSPATNKSWPDMQETGTEEIEEIMNEEAVSQSGYGENRVGPVSRGFVRKFCPRACLDDSPD